VERGASAHFAPLARYVRSKPKRRTYFASELAMHAGVLEERWLLELPGRERHLVTSAE